MAVALPELVFGLLSGASGVGLTAMKLRGSTQQRFYERYERRMTELEAKVVECEKERPIIQILTLGMCMTVPELQRLSRIVGEPRNPVLDQVANAFEALPQDRGDLSDLLARLRREPGVYTPAEEGELGNGA